MAWTQHLLVWLFVMSTSAYKCKHCFGFAPQYPIFGSQADDHPSAGGPIVARSAEHEQLRTNERSLPVSSEAQRIQYEERKRHNKRVEDTWHRFENGSFKILNTPSKPYITTRRSEEDSSSVKIVFPGPTAERSYVPEVPDECKRIGICDSIPNYPEEHVANIISGLGDKGRIFQLDELDVSDTPEIAQRLGPQEDNMELCSYREKIIYPTAAPDREGRWYMVVNSKDNPVQGFKVEICDNNQSPCAEFASFHQGYEARCVQKYVRRTMAALDAKGQMTEMALKVPSCCSCVAKLTIS